MSTQTLTQQVHLVNIISIAQDKLQTNFKTIVSRLKNHDTQIRQQTQLVKSTEQQLLNLIRQNQQKNNKQIARLQNQVQKCLSLISSLTQKQNDHSVLIKSFSNQNQKLSKQIIDLSSIMDEKIGQKENQLCLLQQKINKAQTDLYKAYEQILKKQDSTEVLKIHKQVQNARQKIIKNEKQNKVLEHKLQKLQILNQKNERNQAKRQLEFIKQMEQKMKKQLKGLQKYIPNTSSRYSSPVQPLNDFNDISQQNSSLNSPKKDTISQNQKPRIETMLINKQSDRISFNMQIQQMKPALQKNSQNAMAAKLTQRLSILESKFKSVDDLMKDMSQAKKKNTKSQNEQNLKQKINEIKPQMIKLWAKCDTLDDRIVFNQRKIEQKTKIINSLIETQKQNGVGRLDQKFKLFQTQIYASLKELKGKVQLKVNCQQYQKQSLALDDKLKQIGELIFLKSDKLQVKKALLFLQSKIKQIILVISQDQQNQKDALLTKKQLKCMSCDKDIDKISKFAGTSTRGNWDSMPMKQHSPELLGKFGMTGFGTLSKKLKKLQSKDLPLLKSKKNNSGILQPIINTVPQQDHSSYIK